MDFLALLVTTRDFSRGLGWLKQGVCYRNSIVLKPNPVKWSGHESDGQSKKKLTALFCATIPLIRRSVGTPSILQYAYQ